MSIELIHNIARRTMEYPFKGWGFGEGIAIEALWEAGGLLDAPEYRRFVIGLLERWLHREPRLVEADHSAPGNLLLTAYEASHEARYLDLALDLAHQMMRLPSADTKARFHRPQHPDYASYIYVDCVEVDAPFFCHLASVTGRDEFYDFATEQLLSYTTLLFNGEMNLFYHQYDGSTKQVNGAFWGRGNGWALLGYLKTLNLLPKQHHAYEQIATIFTRLANSLLRFQHSDGTWSTVLDQPEFYREASLPAMFGYGIKAGIEAGLLPDSYMPAVTLAWEAVQRNLTPDGLLRGVSVATPPGDAQHYNQIATGSGFPWGQGPALLFALSRLSTGHQV
jgi:unsaturated rhamnogalacturonyl hydrolase